MQEQGLAYSLSQLLPKLIFLSLILFYSVSPIEFDLNSLISAHVAAITSVCLLYGWNTRKHWLVALKQKIDHSKLPDKLRFGGPLILGGLAYWGLTLSDRIFLKELSSYEQLGIYSVAASIAGAAAIMQSVFSIIWAPTVYKWESRKKSTDRVKHVSHLILIAVLVLFCVTGAFSWLVDFVLPPKYWEVKYLIVACVGFPLFYTLSETTVVGINLSKKTIYATAASVIALLINVLGNLVLIPLLNAKGAAISTVIAFWLFLVLRTEFSHRLWHPLPRMGLYTLTALPAILTIVSVLYGPNMQSLLHIGWLALLLLVVVSFKDSALQSFSFLRMQTR